MIGTAARFVHVSRKAYSELNTDDREWTVSSRSENELWEAEDGDERLGFTLPEAKNFLVYKVGLHSGFRKSAVADFCFRLTETRGFARNTVETKLETI